jgi:hypothetical protein
VHRKRFDGSFAPAIGSDAPTYDCSDLPVQIDQLKIDCSVRASPCLVDQTYDLVECVGGDGYALGHNPLHGFRGHPPARSAPKLGHGSSPPAGRFPENRSQQGDCELDTAILALDG